MDSQLGVNARDGTRNGERNRTEQTPWLNAHDDIKKKNRGPTQELGPVYFPPIIVKKNCFVLFSSLSIVAKPAVVWA